MIWLHNLVKELQQRMKEVELRLQKIEQDSKKPDETRLEPRIDRRTKEWKNANLPR